MLFITHEFIQSFLCPPGFLTLSQTFEGFPGSEPVNAESAGLIPGWGRSLGVSSGNPLQHSWLENPMDRGVHVVAKDFSMTQ